MNSSESDAQLQQAARDSVAGNPSKPHFLELDVLRGLAILGVFLFHLFGQIFGYTELPWNGNWPDFRSAPSWEFFALSPATLGNLGVPLFFVLSGFVIQYSYDRDASSWLLFFNRRFWRIYPAYALAVIVFALLERLNPLKPPFTYQWVSHLLAFHNFRRDWVFAISPAFWSLAVEIQFYLMFPCLVWLQRRLGALRSFQFATALSLIYLSIVLPATHFSPSLPLALNPLPLWWTWCLGAYLAQQYQRGQRLFSHPLLVATATLLLIVLSHAYRPTFALSFHISSIGFAALVERSLYRRTHLGAIKQALAWLGLCSYSFYLWHQPLMEWWTPWINRQLHLSSPMAQFGVSGAILFVVQFALSWVSFIAIEKPAVKLGRAIGTRLKTRAFNARSPSEVVPLRQ